MPSEKKKKMSPVLRKRMMQEWFRILIQLVFFIIAPSVYSAAFTGVKNIFTGFGEGMPLEWNSFFRQLVVVLSFTILFGRFFCGWACAFGAVNDWIFRFSNWIQKKIKKKLPKPGDKAVSALQLLKYVVLVFLLGLCFLQKGSLITANSPWTAFSLIRSMHFEALVNCRVGGILLGILFLGMAWHERFFCQFFCPMGAVFSLLPAMPFLKLKRHSEKCPQKCGACKKICPVNLLMEDGNTRSGECIRCGRCSGICPKKNISTLVVLNGNEIWLDLIKATALLAGVWMIH